MKMAERGREKGNFCCVLNCLSRNDGHLLAQMFTELLGREVTNAECVTGSKLAWHVNNKYYSAEVALFVHQTVKEALDSMKSYEALVILCNLSKSNVVEVVSKRWEELEEQLSPDVCLLVGSFDSDNKEAQSNQSELLGWCVGNGFELIEWEKTTPTQAHGGSPEESDDDDGLPPDPVGISRVSDALQAHMWPIMEEAEGKKAGGQSTKAAGGGDDGGTEDKEEKGVAKKDLSKLEAEVAGSLAVSREEAKKRVDGLLSEEERLIAEGLDSDKDPGGESFESLFARFAEMKQHAESLPHEERKQYAEKVVMAFWNAIGGDEDEVKPDDNDK